MKEVNLKRLHTILFQLLYMTLWKKKNHRDSKRLVVAREKGIGINEQSTGFYVSKTTLYDIMMMEICHTYLSKPLEC